MSPTHVDLTSAEDDAVRSDAEEALRAAVDRAARLLPAQGPINVFIHHNTLHAFEDETFEVAVCDAARRYGRESFLAEDDYRAALRRGRILPRDLGVTLDRELGHRATDLVAFETSRRELWRGLLIFGIPDAGGPALDWLVSETDAITRFRADLSGDVLARLRSAGVDAGQGARESDLVGHLWQACLAAVGRSRHRETAASVGEVRPRDMLLALAEIDIDEDIDPLLIRFVSAYLDQGLADWPIPHRERGLHACFLELFGRPLTRLSSAFASDLLELIAEERVAVRDGWSSVEHSLAVLGIAPEERGEVLVAEALALGGWAGMVRQFETRPDRVPTLPVPARLIDYLAVRLLVTRAAAAHGARRAGLGGSLAEIRTAFVQRGTALAEISVRERAWRVFQAAQICGIGAPTIVALSTSEITSLENELATCDARTRRRLLHDAYERHLRHRFYDAAVQHLPPATGATVAYQGIFCIDEREESFRRHLEEVDPSAETFGAAGYFGVAMYFRAATDAHPRPLCPVAIRPQNYVSETRDEGGHRFLRWGLAWSRWSALVGKNVHFGSKRLGTGAVIMATLGILSLVPLVLRVLLPWSRRIGKMLDPREAGGRRARLLIERLPNAPPVGRHAGFSPQEMAEVVHSQLAPLGIRGRFTPLVLVMGHGSTSLNNPQESAHDCGACGGGHGGPNARAFAQMANDPEVRRRAASLGTTIPAETFFVGGERNTANNDVLFYDVDLLPDDHLTLFERAKASLETARRREAHERCRRFDTAPLWWSPQAALLHVQSRAADLAQPRPEYGHASNACCLVGRRSRSRSLFLDRRAFLVSYDCTDDSGGVLLGPLLAAVLPVVAGISLEYFFGTMDPVGFGSGTKLPHNVTGMLGVMDGAQSDLRPGLPWQMLEIHEPVRLTIIVEAEVHVLQRVVETDEHLRRLVANRWIFLAALDPETSRLDELDPMGARRYSPEDRLPRIVGSSRAHYEGQRQHLPFVALTPTVPEIASSAP